MRFTSPESSDLQTWMCPRLQKCGADAEVLAELVIEELRETDAYPSEKALMSKLARSLDGLLEKGADSFVSALVGKLKEDGRLGAGSEATETARRDGGADEEEGEEVYVDYEEDFGEEAYDDNNNDDDNYGRDSNAEEESGRWNEEGGEDENEYDEDDGEGRGRKDSEEVSSAADAAGSDAGANKDGDGDGQGPSYKRSRVEGPGGGRGYGGSGGYGAYHGTQGRGWQQQQWDGGRGGRGWGGRGGIGYGQHQQQQQGYYPQQGYQGQRQAHPGSGRGGYAAVHQQIPPWGDYNYAFQQQQQQQPWGTAQQLTPAPPAQPPSQEAQSDSSAPDGVKPHHVIAGPISAEASQQGFDEGGLGPSYGSGFRGGHGRGYVDRGRGRGRFGPNGGFPGRGYPQQQRSEGSTPLSADAAPFLPSGCSGSGSGSGADAAAVDSGGDGASEGDGGASKKRKLDEASEGALQDYTNLKNLRGKQNDVYSEEENTKVKLIQKYKEMLDKLSGGDKEVLRRTIEEKITVAEAGLAALVEKRKNPDAVQVTGTGSIAEKGQGEGGEWTSGFRGFRGGRGRGRGGYSTGGRGRGRGGYAPQYYPPTRGRGRGRGFRGRGRGRGMGADFDGNGGGHSATEWTNSGE